jgi:formate-dependent nitrite reductase membrane component NrfD
VNVGVDHDGARLKAPVWTWEIPAYFFVGGAAGAAAVVAAAAATIGGDAALARHARWIAAAGALLAPLLLISDLGRPARFLHMLRVVKLRSPMSMGVWTLVVFAGAVFSSIALDVIGAAVPAAAPLRTAADFVSAGTGLVLATYTGVLIGTTAIPVWSSSARTLPFHFGASAMGAAVSILELIGHRAGALNRVGMGAAAIETVVLVVLERRRDRAANPLRTGRSGALTRAGVTLTGPVALAFRLAAGSLPIARPIAAVCAIIGSLLARIGWIAAGRTMN